MGIAGLAGGLLASYKLAQHVARSFTRREFVANLIKRLALPAPLRQQEELRHIGNLIHTPTPRGIARLHDAETARTFIARTLNVAARQPNQRFHLGNLPAVCHFVAHSLPSFLPANLFNV